MNSCMTFDLDGTLLNHESKLSKENVESLKEAQKRGIEIIVATGRNYPDVVEIFKETGIKTWIIAANGATIHTPDGELMHDVPMEKKKALDLLKWLEENDYYYEVFSKNYLYTPQTARELITIEMDRLCTANPDIDRAELEHYANTQFKQTNFSFINSYKDLEDESIPVYNILAFSFDLQKLAKGWETFKEDTSVTLVTSGKYNFEFEHLLASKGHALTKLADHLGISLQETLAMGDSMNDLSMLSLVGYPVAMGNAREDVKAVCLEVTDTNDQNGVAKTINKMLNQIEVAN
ncbi:Cof-type HAD-IIB family hydrolase [Niallia nealsonii]|uniref:Cof-type HAD-IIB family hydrolase n=1 Tax=Niallia nealsonii TaxID=115979 RepID=A0A2N0Z1A8_9BACI|nr:Cof-type HAD-IIB family hydrolase [Niallia nealsonii]PKG23277.1 Cof-type HAD-IIB family hydrolase [Niallia nealsonii]